MRWTTRCWVLTALLLAAACGGMERTVPGTYALDRALMAKAVAVALGYGPEGNVEVTKVPEKEAQAMVQTILNTAVVIAMNEDGTFVSTTVVNVKGQPMRRVKKGTWKPAGDQIEMTTTEDGGRPMSDTRLAEYDGERIVLWEHINDVQINAVFVRQRPQ